MCYKTAYHPRRARHQRKQEAKKWFRERMANAFHYPPVNVEELEDKYQIYVYAAGYAKGDFKINLTDNVLTISVENSTTETVESTNWKSREFRAESFERNFELNDKIDKESITAKYEDGILKITLAKLPGFETVKTEIDIK